MTKNYSSIFLKFIHPVFGSRIITEFRQKLFIIGLILCSINVGVASTIEVSFTDSIYRATSKTNRIKKLLLYPAKDFNDSIDIKATNTILDMHNLGGVIIQNGEVEIVKNWINVRKQKSKQAPLFILEVADILDFPLNGLPQFPDKIQMELISDKKLISDLGKNFGDLARYIGFEILIIDPSQYDSTLQFDKPDKVWIKHYLDGIKSSGITMVLGNNSETIKDQITITDLVRGDYFSGVTINKLNPENLPIKSRDRKRMNFNGTVLDRLESLENPETAFNHGNDLLILPVNSGSAKSMISYLISNYKMRNVKLRRRFNRYINLKNQVKKPKRSDVNLSLLANDLSINLQNILIGSVVCLKNEENLLPFKNLELSHFASLAGNSSQDNIFRNYLDKYTKVAHYNFDYLNNEKKAFDILSHFNQIVVNVGEVIPQKKEMLELLISLHKNSEITIIYSGGIKELESWALFDALIWIPQDLKSYASLTPQYLFGGINTTGSFPYKLPNLEPITLSKCDRLSYTSSDNKGVNSYTLNKINMLVSDAIATYTMPGCQIMMIKDGKVVYDQNFGYSTYDSLSQINEFALYDIASLTKVIATNPALMYLDQKDKIHINDKLEEHLILYENSDKSDITIKDLLRHQSGLRSYIPFWRKAEIDHEQDFKYKLPKKRRSSSSQKYLTINWQDSIQTWIKQSTYNSLINSDSTYGYLYSDLGYMVLQDLAEKKLNQTMGDFLTQYIYAPLGMTATRFDPLCHFSLVDIVPTEQDNHLRNELIWGKVHDRNAALMNGESGHAGLFSNANDLGKYLQMHLQEGKYGGQTFFEEKVIKEFTTKSTDSERRALGWDKPNKEVENVSKYASELSYGHTGFTGTMVWVDPKYQFIYIFLSNRVYPDAKNNKLSENNIRTKIQDIMYESFLKSKFE